MSQERQLPNASGDEAGVLPNGIVGQLQEIRPGSAELWDCTHLGLVSVENAMNMSVREADPESN